MRALDAIGHALAVAGSMTWQITNLVIELGIIMALLLSWQFTLAEFAGGPVMIVLVAVAFRLFVRKRLIGAARQQADRGLAGSMEGHAAMDMSIAARGSFWRRLASREGYTSVSHIFVMEWAAVIRDVVLGLLIAGAVGAWVPESFWQHLFLTSHPLGAKLWGPLIGPVISVLSFVCSIGNVPLAAVLWNGGISFGGVIAFIFADLIILPITWNYTTILNIVFLLLAAALLIRFFRSGGRPMLTMMGGASGARLRAHCGTRSGLAVKSGYPGAARTCRRPPVSACGWRFLAGARDIMQVRLLGPVDVVVDGQPRLIGGRRRTGVLTVLALAAGEVVSAEWLSEAVWGGGSPPRDNTLHSHISALRRVLGKDVIVAHPPGYVLNLGADGTDVQAAERLLRRGAAAAEPAQAVADLRAALALWRGEPLTGVADLPGLAGQPGRLEGLRAQIRRALVEARLAAGEHHQLTGELEQMVTADPLDEQLHAQLMLALYRAGRQAEALAAYDRIRQTLAGELGIDPGHALRDLHAAILRQDQSLAAPAPTAAASAAAAAPVPAQLPLAVPGFTGRTAELARLDALLPPDDRAGTTSPTAPMAVPVISGTPGVGKTALAVHWAHRITHRFPGGQLYADLRGFDPAGTAVSPAEALHGFLLALGVPPDRVPADVEAQTALYRTRLAGRRVLIVLDNVRDPAQVRPLLPGTPGCLAVVTSRQQLTSLTVTENASPLILDLMPAAEARDLLAARLGGRRADAEAGAVDEIIASCARLPLALAIAAARAAARPGFTLAELAAELRGPQPGLDALAAGDPAVDVRAVFSWSYHALTPAAAGLFRLLSLAPGPDITAPAAASLTALPLPQARRLLTDLATAHLLTEHAPRRYACHDLLRAYARELAGSHDSDDILDAALDRVLGHYLHTSHTAAMLIEPGAGPIAVEPLPPGASPVPLATAEAARDWFTAEVAALLAAVRLAAEAGRGTYAWQLAQNLTAFLVRRGRWDDIAQAQGTALEAARRTGDLAGEANALHSLAVGHIWSGRTGEAGPLSGQALRLFESIGDHIGQARSHGSLGWLADNAGRLDEAMHHTEQAIRLYRAAGYRPGEAVCLNDIGWHHARLGDYEQALTCCEQALQALRETGGGGWEANILDSLGYIHHQLGNRDSSIACYQRALGIFRDVGDRPEEAEALGRLGDVLHGSGDTEAARRAWLEALHIYDEIDHPDAEEIRAKLQPPGAQPESSSA